MASKTENLRQSYATYDPMDIEKSRARRRPKNETLKKAVKVGSGVLLTTVTLATAESNFVARTINSIINGTANALTTPKPPTEENASKISIGDRIRFKDVNGKAHELDVRTISDITAAAREVNPDLNYGTFNAMLEGENHNSNLVHDGEVFTVDKNLGIEDVGPSGE